RPARVCQGCERRSIQGPGPGRREVYGPGNPSWNSLGRKREGSRQAAEAGSEVQLMQPKRKQQWWHGAALPQTVGQTVSSAGRPGVWVACGVMAFENYPRGQTARLSAPPLRSKAAQSL